MIIRDNPTPLIEWLASIQGASRVQVKSEMYTPSALESKKPWLKSWLCRIFSIMSSASTLVASTLFSWFSMEFCFTGCLEGKKPNTDHITQLYLLLDSLVNMEKSKH